MRKQHPQGSTYPFAQAVEDLDLYQCLVVEPLRVADDLDRHGLAGAMVATVQHLTE